MKTIIIAFMVCTLGLCAQTPPAAAPTNTNEEALRQALRKAIRGTNTSGQAPAEQVVPQPAANDAQPSSSNAPPAVTTNAPPATAPAVETPANTTPPAPPPAAIEPAAVITNAPPVRSRRGARTAIADQTDPASRGAAPVTPGANPPTAQPAIIDPAQPAPGVPTVAQPGSAVQQNPVAPAEPEPIAVKPGEINFVAANLDQVLLVYGEYVGRTILKPTSLPNTTQITLRNTTPLTKTETIQLLNAALGINGIATVNVGEKIVKVVASGDANTMGAEFSKQTAAELPDLGPYVTHVVQLKYTKPSEMVQALQPFASKIPNPILAVETSQMLILRDFSENVKRMLEIIAQVDVVTPAEYTNEVILIKYALASEIASALNSLSTGGGNASIGGGGAAGGRAPGTSVRTGTSGFGRPGLNSGTYPGAPGTINPGGVTQPGGAAPGSSFQDRLNNIIRRASVSGEIQILGQTKIIADERTNALLVYASREDMKIIKDIISKLDVVLPQVLIEAVIIEINLNNDHSLGVSYLQTHPTVGANATGIGALNNTSGFLNRNSFMPNGGTNGGTSLPGGFSYLLSFNDLDVTIQAIASDSRARVLQKPRIQTSHAVPATIFVGESRPYPSGVSGYSYGSFASVQQLNIGVTLDVTPLINPDGLVVMEIHQTIENASGSVAITGIGDVPITSRKEAQAKVAVRDKETIILGGLIETTKSKSASGIPVLKDIPFLGYAFRSTTEKVERDELLVLIRPTVLPTPEIAAQTARLEESKMPELRKLQEEGDSLQGIKKSSDENHGPK